MTVCPGNSSTFEEPEFQQGHGSGEREGKGRNSPVLGGAARKRMQSFTLLAQGKRQKLSLLSHHQESQMEQGRQLRAYQPELKESFSKDWTQTVGWPVENSC